MRTRSIRRYGTFVVANWASNFLLHPTQKLDYGFANRLIGRPVDNEFWGTKSQHILAIAAPLAVIDHLSIDLWQKKLLPAMGIKAPFSFAGTPGPFIIHLITFAYGGIMAYVAWDSAFNPKHEGKRWEAFSSKAYPELRGCWTMPLLPIFGSVTSHLLGGAAVGHGTPAGLIPPTLAFAMVKGWGMTDWGDITLTPFERKLNGLDKPCEDCKTAGKAPAA
eukprot:tig00020904_g15206.t1